MSVPEKQVSMEVYARDVVNAIEGGVKQLAHGAAVYVKALDDEKIDNEAFRQLCREKGSFIPAGFWRGMEKVGRGLIHWKVLIGGAGRYEAKISRLPLSVQAEIVDGTKVEVVTPGRDILKVDVRQVDQDLARQVFAEDHIRTTAEQKAWLVSRARPAEKPTVSQAAYEIDKDGCHILMPITLKIDQLKRIIREMER